MSPAWIYRNITQAWAYRGSWTDFWRRLLWIYSGKLPALLKRDEQIICFRYPYPLNKLTLLVRSNGGSDAFIFSEVFQHRYYDLPLVSPPTTILDLGANAGFTAIYFGRYFPTARIACVEPIPGNIRILRRNCELNAISASIFSAAVAVEDGEMLMELCRMDFGHRVAEQAVEVPGATMKVDAISIPTLLHRLGWDRVSLLKVDIEGYERILFSGECPWLTRVDAMCIECHEGFGEEDLRRLALWHGFLSPKRLPGVWFLGRS